VLWSHHFSRGESRNRVFEQVEAAIAQMDEYQTLEDLEALKETRGVDSAAHLEDPEYRSRSSAEASSTNFQRYRTPSGFEVLIGRNNQNDQLTFRLAGDYDLWFHAQDSREHVLLRLKQDLYRMKRICKLPLT